MITEPVVIPVDEKDFESLVASALHDASGQRIEVFSLQHDETGEDMIVLLPDPGPSLAAALRDWCAAWWTKENATVFGTPERYLQGFGVDVPAGEYVTFSRSCPYCYAYDQLSVISGQFEASGLRIEADGFAFDDAKQVNTTDVQVHCEACDRTFSANAIQL